MSSETETAKSWKKPLAMALLLGGGGAVGYVAGRGVAQLDGLRARFDLLLATLPSVTSSARVMSPCAPPPRLPEIPCVHS